MQHGLRQAASNLARRASTTNPTSSSSSLLHSQPYRTFPSVSKLSAQNQPFGSTSSPTIHRLPLPWRSLHSYEVSNGLVSYPLLANRFLFGFSNTQLVISRNFLANCTVRFVGGRNPNFGFGPSFGYQRAGWRSWFHHMTPTGTVLGLVAVNAAVFILWRVVDERFMMRNFMISLDNLKNGRVHTLITSAFSHIDPEHIISNMIGLYFFGINIAGSFGPEYLLKLYLAGAIGGSVCYLLHQSYLVLSSKRPGMWTQDPSKASALGASGAVNAIMLLGIFLNPTATIFFDFIIPVPAMLLGVFLIGKDVLRMIEGKSNISGSAHLGGAAVAALAWTRIKRGRF